MAKVGKKVHFGVHFRAFLGLEWITYLHGARWMDEIGVQDKARNVLSFLILSLKMS